MERAHFAGKTARATLDSSRKTISVAVANTNGAMAVVTKENGRRIKCMDKESSGGLTAECTRVSLSTIAKRAKVRSLGRIIANMKAPGSPVSKMAMDGSQARKANDSKATGSREKSSGGLTRMVSGVTRIYRSRKMHQINNLNLDNRSNNKKLRRVIPYLPGDEMSNRQI